MLPQKPVWPYVLTFLKPPQFLRTQREAEAEIEASKVLGWYRVHTFLSSHRQSLALLLLVYSVAGNWSKKGVSHSLLPNADTRQRLDFISYSPVWTKSSILLPYPKTCSSMGVCSLRLMLLLPRSMHLQFPVSLYITVSCGVCILNYFKLAFPFLSGSMST